jgi:hypothetical protein
MLSAPPRQRRLPNQYPYMFPIPLYLFMLTPTLYPYKLTATPMPIKFPPELFHL